jgi:hypothetical protein
LKETEEGAAEAFIAEEAAAIDKLLDICMLEFDGFNNNSGIYEYSITF